MVSTLLGEASEAAEPEHLLRTLESSDGPDVFSFCLLVVWTVNHLGFRMESVTDSVLGDQSTQSVISSVGTILKRLCFSST